MFFFFFSSCPFTVLAIAAQPKLPLPSNLHFSCFSCQIKPITLFRITFRTLSPIQIFRSSPKSNKSQIQTLSAVVRVSSIFTWFLPFFNQIEHQNHILYSFLNKSSIRCASPWLNPLGEISGVNPCLQGILYHHGKSLNSKEFISPCLPWPSDSRIASMVERYLTLFMLK